MWISRKCTKTRFYSSRTQEVMSEPELTCLTCYKLKSFILHIERMRICVWIFQRPVFSVGMQEVIRTVLAWIGVRGACARFSLWRVWSLDAVKLSVQKTAVCLSLFLIYPFVHQSKILIFILINIFLKFLLHQRKKWATSEKKADRTNNDCAAAKNIFILWGQVFSFLPLVKINIGALKWTVPFNSSMTTNRTNNPALTWTQPPSLLSSICSRSTPDLHHPSLPPFFLPTVLPQMFYVFSLFSLPHIPHLSSLCLHPSLHPSFHDFVFFLCSLTFKLPSPPSLPSFLTPLCHCPFSPSFPHISHLSWPFLPPSLHI